MPSETVIGMSIFGLLILGGLCVSIYQGAQQRRRLAHYSSNHGWSVSRKADDRLKKLLEAVDPKADWDPWDVMVVDRVPANIYLFGYHVSPKDRPSSTSHGHACLAEHGGARREGMVEIFSRTPGADKLISGRVEAGSEEFRKAFTVTSESQANALAVVNQDVERVLLEHANGLGWQLTVTVGGGGILVASFWAESEEEWDYLIEFTKRLRGAVR